MPPGRGSDRWIMGRGGLPSVLTSSRLVCAKLIISFATSSSVIKSNHQICIKALGKHQFFRIRVRNCIFERGLQEEGDA